MRSNRDLRTNSSTKISHKSDALRVSLQQLIQFKISNYFIQNINLSNLMAKINFIKDTKILIILVQQNEEKNMNNKVF